MNRRAIVCWLLALIWCAVAGAADDAKITLHILAFDQPQAQAEQRLADARFTPATGIRVVLETNSTADLDRKLTDATRTGDSRYDLFQYDAQWLGRLVAAQALEKLDGTNYFGDDAHSPRVLKDLTQSEVASMEATALPVYADFRPEISFRLGKYPTIEDDLVERRFDRYLDKPVYGLPWCMAAQIFVYRDDVVSSAFAGVQPSVAQYYRASVEPNWKDQWRLLVSAAGLVQISNPGMNGIVARGGATPDGILQDFLPILWAFGGEICDEANGRTQGILNSDSNVQALEYYCEWNGKRKLVSSDSVNGGDAEAVRALADGRAAMGVLPPWFGPMLEQQPRTAGRIGYALLPGIVAVSLQSRSSESALDSLDSLKKLQTTTTIRRATLNSCEGIGINARSGQKAAAWKYLQWLMSRSTQLALIFEKGSAFCSARKDLVEESRSASPWNRAVIDQFGGGFVRSSWNSPLAARLNQVLALECNLAFRGVKTPREALDAAAQETQDILDHPGPSSR